MKKVAIILVAMFFPVLVNAQFEKLINTYSGQEGVTVVNIGPELFQVMKGLNIEEIDEAELPMDKVSGVKILVIENQDILNEIDFFSEVTDGLNTGDFVEVMTVKDGKDDIKMWLKNDAQQILEFLLVVSSPDEGVMVHISGDFSMSDIEGLAESFGDLDAFEDFEIN